MNDSNFSCNVFTIKDGLLVYNKIKLIRIKSKNYNLLIMKDYMPIIGEIDGSVDIEGEDINKSFKDIKAFYMSKENEFNLIIRKEKEQDGNS